jgi:Zn finger protein HypA/HybF involved in hydrogenase expression
MATILRYPRIERNRDRDQSVPEEALATVEQFNIRLAARLPAWCWPTIAAALVSKHHWLVTRCDACGDIIETDLTMKRRDANAAINLVLEDLRCSHCKGQRMHVVKLSRFFSIIPR